MSCPECNDPDCKGIQFKNAQAIKRNEIPGPDDTIDEIMPIDDWMPYIVSVQIFKHDAGWDICILFDDLSKILRLPPETPVEIMQSYAKPLTSKLSSEEYNHVIH